MADDKKFQRSNLEIRPQDIDPLQDLENLLNKEGVQSNLRPGAIQINFKFKMGEECYSPLIKQKGIIEDRSYRQTRSGNAYYEYCLWVKEGDTSKEYTLEESWLEKGDGPVQD